MKPILPKQKKSSLPSPLEDQECYTFVDFLGAMKNQGKVIAFTHIANENSMRNGIRVALKKKRLGLHKGFPDYCVITPSQMLFIEMKRKRESHTSIEQLEWIDAINNVGVKAMICFGAGEAIEFVEENI